MTTYTLNTDAAKSADNMNSRINETGQYVGRLTRAEAIKSDKGTIGIDFSFKSDDGQTCDYLTIWTHNGEGKEIFGFKQLMAIMTCLKVKEISPKAGTTEKWDSASNSRIRVKADLFNDLMDKPIGLLLQREEYEKNNGDIGYKMNIFAAFEAATEFTASEILDKAKTPEKLAKLVANLRDKPLKANGQQSRQAPAGNGGSAFDDLEDDIPF